MRNLLTLTRRELLTVFVSPLAYGTAAIFLFVFGIGFVARFTSTRLVEAYTVLDPLGYFLPALAGPLLTMRLISEERRLGTLEMLLTAPVTDVEVVLGKFAGVMIFYAVMLSLTVVHVLTMLVYYDGAVDWGSFFSAYLGALLTASLFLSFGLFVSSFFETPMLGALVAFIAGLAVVTTAWLASAPVILRPGYAQDVFRFMMPVDHFRNFLRGAIDTRDVMYFVLISVFFLFCTTKVLESRKWN